MPNSFTITIDSEKMHEALEGESLRTVIKGFIKGASRVSADRVKADAQARLLRQLSGTSTGETVASIVVKSDRTGWGWILHAGNETTPMLDRWLEKGTKTQSGGTRMAARPFFWDSVRLEEQAHLSRVRDAVDAALSEYGLGEFQPK